MLKKKHRHKINHLPFLQSNKNFLGVVTAILHYVQASYY